MEAIKKLENLINEGDLSAALDYIESLPPEIQRQWQIQNLTGVVCAGCGQFKEAETFFSAALAQQPNDLDTMYNLAETCAALEKFQQAEELLDRCQLQDSEKQLAEEIEALRRRIAEGKGKQVLMIAYYFPPLSGSGVFRSLKFAKYLPQFGWHPTVISTDRPPNGWKFEDRSQVEEIPSNEEVIRVPDRISTGRENSISSDRAQALLGFLRGVLRYSPEADSIFSQVSQFEKGIVDLLTFPCAALSWAYDVVQYIESNVDLSQFQVIYTTSGPQSAHLIGFYLKQKYGIPWVADYRDLWTYNPYGVKYDPSNPHQKLFFELESVLLHQADCNLTIADGAVQSYTDHFKLPREQIVSITNGYDESDFEKLPLSTKKSEKFTINYSGVLYTDQRSVEPVFYALQQLSKEQKIDPSQICFRIVGTGVEDYAAIARKYGLEQAMVQTGYLSHRNALLSNLNADLLLLLVGDDAKFRHVFTGKFFDYLRSGKPILALAPKGGAVAQVLRETGHGESFLSTQTGQIKAMILREYRKWQKSETCEFLHSPKIERFERKVLTEQLAAVLDQVENGTHCETLEISSQIYNRSYLNGGAGGNYHMHYMQSFYYQSWKQAMKYLSNLDRSAAILEIACGTGQFANMIFDHGFTNYVGFDFSTEAVAHAKNNNPGHESQFFVDDAFKSEILNRHFDLIICFEMLEHINKDLKLLSRIHSGTAVLLSVPNFDDPYHVRYFHSVNEVRMRYQKIIDIEDIKITQLSSENCLYYIWGKKS